MRKKLRFLFLLGLLLSTFALSSSVAVASGCGHWNEIGECDDVVTSFISVPTAAVTQTYAVPKSLQFFPNHWSELSE